MNLKIIQNRSNDQRKVVGYTKLTKTSG